MQDMNWREAWSGHSKAFRPEMEKSYGFPNTDLFPDNAGNGTQWFDYLASLCECSLTVSAPSSLAKFAGTVKNCPAPSPFRLILRQHCLIPHRCSQHQHPPP
jgi:hypothetical protein